jgi:hypothetical protein
MMRLKKFARIAHWQLQSAPVQNLETVEHAVFGDGEPKALW